jgi:hypothetical protein
MGARSKNLLTTDRSLPVRGANRRPTEFLVGSCSCKNKTSTWSTSVNLATNLADSLSRNPVGLTPQHIKTATRHKEIMIAAIDMNSDSTVVKKEKKVL